MDQEQINQILEDRIALVGAVTGAVSGILRGNPAASAGDAAAGYAGALLGTRALKTETAASSAVIEVGKLQQTQASLSGFLHIDGQKASDDPETVRYSGTIGSGFLNLNPAYVLVLLNTTTGQLRIAAYAKEGRIKQNTAGKVVAKLCQRCNINVAGPVVQQSA